MSDPRTVAIIPARAGSKRIKGKNTKVLAGSPLIAYTIALARNCKLIDEVFVSTDSKDTAQLAVSYGASVPSLRPLTLAQDRTHDWEWLAHEILAFGISDSLLVLLRPTNPLRSVGSLESAISAFKSSTADSLRAVRPVTEHPGKMWKVLSKDRMSPFLESPTELPSHSLPTQLLEKLFIQDASLEITRAKRLLQEGSLAGKEVMPFMMPGFEGFDLNTEYDWMFLEWLIQEKIVSLPQMEVK